MHVRTISPLAQVPDVWRVLQTDEKAAHAPSDFSVAPITAIDCAHYVALIDVVAGLIFEAGELHRVPVTVSDESSLVGIIEVHPVLVAVLVRAKLSKLDLAHIISAYAAFSHSQAVDVDSAEELRFESHAAFASERSQVAGLAGFVSSYGTVALEMALYRRPYRVCTGYPCTIKSSVYGLLSDAKCVIFHKNILAPRRGLRVFRQIKDLGAVRPA